MIYQPEVMATDESLAIEEVQAIRLENQQLVQSCILYGIGSETPVWLAYFIAVQFGTPVSVLKLARSGDDVRRMAQESYLIASKKGTKWAIKRCLKLCGIDIDIQEAFGATYSGDNEYGGNINHSGGTAAPFHVKVVVLKGQVEQNKLYEAVRDMLPVRCYLRD
jgi:hypothetical protein